MKKPLYIIMLSGALLSLDACQKDFLQKPETTGTTTIETVFSNTASAEGAIAAAYRKALVQNLWDGRSVNNGTLAGISGEMTYGETWASLTTYVSSGFSPNPKDNNKATSPDNFYDNFDAIRKCFIVMENIDRVTDMTDEMKGYIKGEMEGLIAYRYMNMFIHYGGVPIVTKSLAATDNLNIPRTTLQQTLEYVITMADKAAADLPANWEDKYTGRLVKGAALAIKARALTFAARPLFNAASPYLNFGANNELICFGSASEQRWQDAITANEAVISWATANGYEIINTGGAGAGRANPNAFDDYGTATAVPANKEVLLAYKLDNNDDKFFRFYNPTSNNAERYLIDHYGMLSNFISNYYRADGTDQSWPGIGEGNARPYADYAANINAMEPRFKVDNYAHGFDCWINPGNDLWKYVNCSKGSNNANNGTYGHGDAQSVKYYYNAGSRLWFEYPLFRMSEFYLNLAEAYNESGNATKALENLNVVHNRAGLPAITETNQAGLRKIIQREYAIEFYNESHRLFDVRHWKLDEIGNGIIGGTMREFQFTTNGASDRYPENLVSYWDAPSYTAYWNDKMFLDPFPQEEIDKGIIIQNPGY